MVSHNELERVRQTIRRMSDDQKSALIRELSRDQAGDAQSETQERRRRHPDDHVSPFTSEQIAERRNAMTEFRAVMNDVRSRTSLEGTTIRELIEQGRRY